MLNVPAPKEGRIDDLLRLESERELARRLVPGAVIHPALLAVVLLGTPFASEHGWVVAPIGAAIVGINLLRLWLALRWERFQTARRGAWNRLFTATAVATAAAWGALCLAALLCYGLRDFTTLLMLLIISGLATAAVGSLHPVPSLARTFVLIAMGIPFSSFMIHPSHEGVALACVFAVSAAYLVAQAGIQAREYWTAKERAHQFRGLSEASSEGVAIHQGGVIVEVNDAFCRMFGYARGELVGRSITTVFTEDSAPRIRERIARPVEGFHEARGRRKDGSEFAAEMMGQDTLYKGERARVGCIRDITERKMAEMALREATQTMRALIDSSPVSIFLMDLEGRVKIWNAASERIFGWTEAEVTGKPLPFVPPAKRAEADALIARLRAGERIIGYEAQRVRKDGTEIPVKIYSVLTLGADGKPAGIMAILVDITEQNQNEAALIHALAAADQATRAKSEFLANMSHEIRTPLNGILGMVDQLLDSKLTDEQRGHARIVKQSSEGLLTIIADILDFSKIEAGKLDLEDIEFDARHTIRNPVELLQGQARAKGLSLECRIDPGVPDRMLGDPGRLGQVLLNLVGNSLKFTATGSIILSVHREGPMLRFEVRDTGIGIRPEDQARLFQPFTQVDESTARKYGGTGLGLSICKRLVELMGGEIGVESAAGQGSRFWFTIRLRTRSAAPQAGPQPMEPEAAAGLRRILIAEDNAINQMVATTLLRKLGYSTHAVTNGREAVEAMRAQRFDLVLMDCQMPEMDGFEATRAIRQAESGTGRHTPIVALTANALAEDERRCLESGMDAFVTKPVHRDRLAEVLARWISASG